jgi:arsenate reductase
MNAVKTRVLFLCTGNSCRSQMAEALLRQIAGDRFESCSAGSEPSGFVHPLAIEAMHEVGIDISAQRSKSVHEFLPPAGTPPDLIVTVCSSAAANCPVFPESVTALTWEFDDPATAEGTDEEKLITFRRVRNEIQTALERQFGSAGKSGDRSSRV